MRTITKPRCLAAVVAVFGLGFTGACREGRAEQRADDRAAPVGPVAPVAPAPAGPAAPAAPVVPGDTATTPGVTPAVGPPVTVDNQARVAYERQARSRLQRLDARLAALRAKAGAKASSVAAQLSSQRDELARRLDTAGTQAGTGWDQFKADVGRAFDQLEAEVDEAFVDPVR